MPFNDQTDFLDRGINTFSGSINLSRLENSILSFQFSRDQSQIVIHNVYYNYLQQANGLGGLRIDYIPTFIENSISNHPIRSIVGTPPNPGLFDMSGNYITTASRNPGLFDMSGNYITRASRNPSLIDMSGNYIINTNSYNYLYSSSHGRTGPYNIGNYINGYGGSSHHMGSSGAAPARPSSATGSITVLNTGETVINYAVPSGSFIFQVINPERNICNITHDEILVDQQYMTCSNCNIHFLESALKCWLRQRSPNTRTCPTCRELWTNFNIYINRVNSSDLD
jgi:hypothetical protein